MKTGFTLIELLIAMFIALFIAFMGFSLQKQVLTFSDLFKTPLLAQQETRQTFNEFTRALRAASLSTSGSYPLAQASSTSVTFYSDINNDGLTEKIRYFVSGSKLKQGVIFPAGAPAVYTPSSEIIKIAVNNVYNTTSVFSFYDENYDGSTSTPPLSEPLDISAISLVKITITVMSENSLKEKIPATMTTQITIRNIKDNL